MLVYTAEKPAPKLTNQTAEERFVYEPDLGEKYWGKKPPVLVLVRLNGSSNYARLLDIPKHLTPGIPLFVNGDKEIVFVGYPRDPKVWGVIYCINRRNALYSYHLENKTLTSLTDSQKESVRSPRLAGTSLVYLSNKPGGPHSDCSILNSLDLTSKESDTVVDYQFRPASMDAFPGLFVGSLPRQEILNGTIIVNSSWRSRKVVLAVHMPSKSVVDLSPSAEAGSNVSYNLLGVSGNFIFAHRSSPNNPGELVIGKVSISSHQIVSAVWVGLADVASNPVKSLLDSKKLHFDVVERTRSSETILLHQTQDGTQPGDLPLIILPHGGPHSVTTTEWSLAVCGFACLGYGVAMINYTGSIGFGGESVHDLVGKIGNLEVEECHAVAMRLSQRFKSKRIFLYGGSHGGLILGCLLGKHPKFYRAACLRNPVTNVGTFEGSDIMDWAFAEAGFQHDLSAPSLISPEQYQKMWDCSPFRVAKNVVDPVLVMLGELDRRVPNHQAWEWVAYLRGKNKEHDVRMLSFPDTGHALDSVDAECYGFEAIMSFFGEYL
ncbi:Alpha/Beta hydrolase protein [Paraphysoderma sedebokerense]|nr:Alpha/Beta hydrolase protein [Paraphysoderma sedebokerense]KAI9140777.1 Alpha/Beta hydrolase protein [Paraphysoderma sedebokerense]